MVSVSVVTVISRLTCLMLPLLVLPLTGGSASAFVGNNNNSNSNSNNCQRSKGQFSVEKQMSYNNDNVYDTFRLLQIRGGSSLLRRSTTNSDDADNHQRDRQRKRGMALALSTTYLTVMGAKCALPSVLSLLISPTKGLSFPQTTASPQSQMAQLLGFSTLAVALGKLLLGPLIDSLGGIKALQLCLAALTGLLGIISSSDGFGVFCLCWILVDFLFSSCWAACINAIHQSFPPSEWGKQIGMLAAGARTGNTLSFALFASLLHHLQQLPLSSTSSRAIRQPWRYVFGVAGLLQILPLLLLTYFGRAPATVTSSPGKRAVSVPTEHSNHTYPPQSPALPKPKRFQASLVTLRKEATTLEFWLQLLSRSCLMVFVSFLLFVPTLMSQAYKVSDSLAAQGASIYSLGCLLAVTLGSSAYSKLAPSKQAWAVVALNGMATVASLLQLGHMRGWLSLSPNGAFASLFVWGLACSIPFYLPPSIYALEKGGQASSATIADIFDVGGFALLAIFNGYVGSIRHAHPPAWTKTFLLTTVCSLTSLISLPWAILRQNKKSMTESEDEQT